MRIIGMNPGHDGAIAAIEDRKLTLCLESEKDNGTRYTWLSPYSIVTAFEHMSGPPDVVALGGWGKKTGAGYVGPYELRRWPSRFLGEHVTMFTSSHERSHILQPIGMAPRDDASTRAVLCWEGAIGSFYLVDETWTVKEYIPVMHNPGRRYGFLFGLTDPTFQHGTYPDLDGSGKLMALAAFADPSDAGPAVTETVDRVLGLESKVLASSPKNAFETSPIYNAGPDSEATKTAAALITKRIFDAFSSVARARIPAGLPLYISGGCGLNCDWNVQWRDLGHFSSVFVPPCANDSGSALGTAIDALCTMTGDPWIEWDVYSGLEFELDCQPDSTRWIQRVLDDHQLCDVLAEGHIVAWVQGRWEIGPRALGNRSLLAEPFRAETRDRLNEVKQREAYRPIAPCCRVEDLCDAFESDFEDPYMLYFRMVRSGDFEAITHVDGSARCQTVSAETNERLHSLLSAFKARRGVGLLCNTSLNFKGRGFINRMSDLVAYCESTSIDDFVVGERWFQRRRTSGDRPNSDHR